MKNNGLFITFEGPDGSGKSTIINMVYECIHKKYKNIYLTREPGGKNNVIAEDIRNILLNKLDYQIDSRAEALLFAASRAQHVKDFIKPHLLNNDIVLCDRYVHSSLVYQGCARGLGIKEV
jgi:dTMP kinase